MTYSGVNCLDFNQWVSMSSQSGPAPAGRAPPPPQPPAAASSEGDTVAVDAAAAVEVPLPRSLLEMWCEVHGHCVHWHASRAVRRLQRLLHGLREEPQPNSAIRLVRASIDHLAPMATSRDEEEAEKAYKLAENRFLANDIAGALREAREAQRLFPPLPGIANAVAAYEVHHAASRADGGKWYGILAVGHDYATTSSGAITHEDLKQEYRRLCLVLHPDKNSSAAAEGAFKLLREAWDKLSLLHPPGYAAAPVSCPPPPPTATAQPPEWKPRKPGPRRRTMFCPKCRGSFVTVVNDDVSGVNCVNCNRWELAAEKAYKLAENRFLADDITGALRAARAAQRVFPALPGLANAVAAYEVHHAAASRANGGKWYAILAVGDDSATTSSGIGAVTHESLKQQYRRLCLVLHPDKNSSAAAEGAFKLLREAWDKLSLLHPPGSAAVPVSCAPPPPAATAQPPEWMRRQPGPPRRRTMFCSNCLCSFAAVVNDDVSGVNCVNCNHWVSMLWQTDRAPPPPQQQQSSRFPCPTPCPDCEAEFTDPVSIGKHLLWCPACNKCSLVYVQSPNVAYAPKKSTQDLLLLAMAVANQEQAEEACRRAEEFFLAGNIASAHRLARRAQRLCPSLPGVANVLAAYDVHAAATANPGCRPDWYAVLGIDQSTSSAAVTRDAIKRQFRRRSLLVHPDKNRSAAADGAFKLLRQACDALSDRAPHHHPNAGAASAAAANKAADTAAQTWWSEYWARHPEMAAAASRRRGAAADEEKPTRPQGEPPMVIYCKRCDREFVREPDEFGVTCRWCHWPVRPPWERSKPSSPTKAPPPPPPKREMFPCPGQCPRCGVQFASMVCAGKWHLRCKACSKYTMVDVQSPDMATCSR
uniref:J domain-containing protein n=1 Tax=Oryza punctata TaxID=4537 RepID=A0A0E0KLA1_ORYPU